MTYKKIFLKINGLFPSMCVKKEDIFRNTEISSRKLFFREEECPFLAHGFIFVKREGVVALSGVEQQISVLMKRFVLFSESIVSATVLILIKNLLGHSFFYGTSIFADVIEYPPACVLQVHLSIL